MKNSQTCRSASDFQSNDCFARRLSKNKMVVAWNKTITTKTRKQKLKTNNDGQVSFPLDQKGQWMISTVQMIPVIDNVDANYQSYCGNLTFEFE